MFEINGSFQNQLLLILKNVFELAVDVIDKAPVVAKVFSKKKS